MMSPIPAALLRTALAAALLPATIIAQVSIPGRGELKNQLAPSTSIPNVYASFGTDQTLRLFSPSGTELSATPFGFGGDVVTMDTLGRVWIAKGDTARLVALQPTPHVVGAWTLPGAVINNIAISPEGHLWVCDAGNRLLHRLDPHGTPLDAFTHNLQTPVGLAVAPCSSAPEGYYVWFTSTTHSTADAELRRVDPSRTSPDVVLFYGNHRLYGVAVDEHGDVWLPVGVGGSGSTDRLDQYSKDGVLLGSDLTSGWTGTDMSAAIVAPDGGRLVHRVGRSDRKRRPRGSLPVPTGRRVPGRSGRLLRRCQRDPHLRERRRNGAGLGVRLQGRQPLRRRPRRGNVPSRGERPLEQG